MLFYVKFFICIKIKLKLTDFSELNLWFDCWMMKAAGSD